MPPRLPSRSIISGQPSKLCDRRARPLISFSTTARRRADDPAASLAHIISPATASRPSGKPIPSASQTASPGNNAGSNTFNPHPSVGKAQNSRLAQILSNNLPNKSPDSRRKIDETRANNQRRGTIENQITRVFYEGDIYAPRDMSPVEMIKAYDARLSTRSRSGALPLNSRRRGSKDVVDALGINPVAEYKNVAMMGEYVSDMGRIRHSRETGLRAVNQRKMARAIRRSIGIGLMPSVHRHPELHPDRLSLRGQQSTDKGFTT